MDKQQLAIHAAGHATAAYVLGRPFDQVSVADGLEASELTGIDLSPHPSDRRRLEENSIIGLAGSAAEATAASHSGEALQTLNQDHARIAQCIRQLASLQDADAPPVDKDVLVISLWERAMQLLNKHWGAITVLADMLVDFETASWTEVREIYEHTVQWHSRI